MLLFKIPLYLDCKFTEGLYLSNDSRKGVAGSSTVYSEATLVFSSFYVTIINDAYVTIINDA